MPWHYILYHGIIGRAGASPPSRTNSMIFLYNYIYYIIIFIYLYPFNRTSCPKSSTCFFFSDISIFLRRKCYTRFFFSGISIFRNLCKRTYVRIYVIHFFFFVMKTIQYSTIQYNPMHNKKVYIYINHSRSNVSVQ